jgi:hypothetical protein
MALAGTALDGAAFAGIALDGAALAGAALIGWPKGAPDCGIPAGWP